MNNAELIKALRHCANDLPCETESYRCKYADILECNVQLRVDAADALEAADKRIAELEAWQMGWLDRLVQPTVDAVPVVRCGECKYFKDGMCYNPNTYDDEKTCGNTTADWFCSDGERRTE